MAKGMTVLTGEDSGSHGGGGSHIMASTPASRRRGKTLQQMLEESETYGAPF